MQQEAKQVILEGVKEILEDCDCGDPTCPRMFSLAKTPLEFNEKLLTTYRSIVNGQNMMMAEVCDAILRPDLTKTEVVKMKLAVQGERCTQHSAALSLIVMAIMTTSQNRTVASYRETILNTAAKIASENYEVMLQEVQMQDKEKMN